ncbi:hypothetical protein JCM19241_1793 [Vibrio ishigakensis]|uniref:Uncharacterized protein n=1 Tax=Vibrio ishigakensis TaxID=1481914 RepID=A0A0B8QQS0_9VIBR|nr:hypothetical protein JCM19241_1793 [Vibrio ishigakensis]
MLKIFSAPISLRQAVFVPLVVIILAIGVVVSVLLTSHYERIIHHVSQNQLEATTSNLRSSLNLFLKQPFDASFSLAYTIKAVNSTNKAMSVPYKTISIPVSMSSTLGLIT